MSFKLLQRWWNSSIFMGILFHCLATLSVKRFFLMCNLKLPWCSFRDIFTMQSVFFATFGVTSVKQEPVSLRMRKTGWLLHSAVKLLNNLKAGQEGGKKAGITSVLFLC